MAYHHVETIEGVDENYNPIFGNHMIDGDNWGQARSQAATNKANFYLAMAQNRWNLDQWQREQDYNSPIAKRERMLEAGMNPVFYNLDGVANTQMPTSADLANQEAPTIQPKSNTWNNVFGGLKNGLDSLLAPLQLAVEKKKADAQIDNLDSQTGLNKANTQRVATLMGVDIATARKYEKEGYLCEANADLTRQKVEESIQIIGESKTRAKLNEANTHYIKTKGAKEVDLLAEKIKVEKATYSNILEQTNKVILEKALIDGQTESVVLENYAKEIENQFKHRNLSQEFDKNRSEIIKNAYGVFAPMMSAIRNIFHGTLEGSTLKPDYNSVEVPGSDLDNNTY